jgi:hypothetical protein
MNPKDKLFRPAPFRSLKWGLLLLGAGMGLLIAFFHRYESSLQGRTSWNLFCLIAMGGGLGPYRFLFRGEKALV